MPSSESFFQSPSLFSHSLPCRLTIIICISSVKRAHVVSILNLNRGEPFCTNGYKMSKTTVHTNKDYQTEKNGSKCNPYDAYWADDLLEYIDCL